MKEKIYTIPITEAFEQGDECPFCYLEKKFEQNALDYVVGGAHMEVDGREETNQNGFCTKHLSELFNSKRNTLGLALILDTYLQNFTNDFKTEAIKAEKLFQRDMDVRNQGIAEKFKNVIGKSVPSDTRSAISSLVRATGSKRGNCTVCKRVIKNMDRAISNFFATWKNNNDFKMTFLKRNDICMKHYEMLIEVAPENLSGQKCAEFCSELIIRQIRNLEVLEGDLDWFTKKFDYNNQAEPWRNSKDAVPRTIKRLKGNVDLK